MILQSHRTLRLVLAVVSAVGLSALDALAASAQDLEELRQSYRIAPIPSDAVIARPLAPGASLNTPGAWGASWGLAFAGVGYQQRTRFLDQNDGAVFVGFGLGDAVRTVGIEVTLSSTSTVRTGFLERTTMSAKLHRIVGNDISVAVGYENAAEFGGVGDGGQSLYAVAGKAFVLGAPTEHFSQITVQLGVGDGRFRSEDDINAGRDGVGVFGSVAVRATERLAAIADWTGQDLALGLSIVPLPDVPLILTPALVDVTGSAGDGTRFTLGLGLATRFLN